MRLSPFVTAIVSLSAFQVSAEKHHRKRCMRKHASEYGESASIHHVLSWYGDSSSLADSNYGKTLGPSIGHTHSGEAQQGYPATVAKLSGSHTRSHGIPSSLVGAPAESFVHTSSVVTHEPVSRVTASSSPAALAPSSPSLARSIAVSTSHSSSTAVPSLSSSHHVDSSHVVSVSRTWSSMSGSSRVPAPSSSRVLSSSHVAPSHANLSRSSSFYHSIHSSAHSSIVSVPALSSSFSTVVVTSSSKSSPVTSSMISSIASSPVSPTSSAVSSAVPSSPAPPSLGPNQLVNPDFTPDAAHDGVMQYGGNMNYAPAPWVFTNGCFSGAADITSYIACPGGGAGGFSCVQIVVESGCLVTLGQTIATVPGSTYQFSFLYSPLGTNPSGGWTCSAGATTMTGALAGSVPTAWSTFTSAFVATGGSTTVSCTWQASSERLYVTEVKVQQMP